MTQLNNYRSSLLLLDSGEHIICIPPDHQSDSCTCTCSPLSGTQWNHMCLPHIAGTSASALCGTKWNQGRNHMYLLYITGTCASTQCGTKWNQGRNQAQLLWSNRIWTSSPPSGTKWNQGRNQGDCYGQLRFHVRRPGIYYNTN